MGLEYHRHLISIAQKDVARVTVRDVGYGGSWRNAGGRGAFENLRRKWDRIVTAVGDPATEVDNVVTEGEVVCNTLLRGGGASVPIGKLADVIGGLIKVLRAGDIFRALSEDQSPTGLIMDIRDLRRYLLLFEAHATEKGWVTEPEPEED